jgi:hypothetical protein
MRGSTRRAQMRRTGCRLNGKFGTTGQYLNWPVRADCSTAPYYGYTKVMQVVSAEQSPLPRNSLLEIPEAQSATN